MQQRTELNQGTVFKKALGQYTVHANGRTVLCSISSKLRKELVYPLADPSSRRRRVDAVGDIRVVDPVAIGDAVSFVDAGDGVGAIVEVLPRCNQLSRRAPGARPLEQVVAANVDQIVPVFAAARPAPKWSLLDRYLTDSEATGIPAVVCITKIDLVSGAEQERIEDEMHVYERIGYRVLFTSAAAGEGIDGAREILKKRVSVLMGKSGVGKTTLLNAIQPGLGLRVNEVSRATGKGKHTTSHLEMFPLVFGGAVVDTPGMREFGLWDAGGADLAELFPEMRPRLGQCRFAANCTHTHEPGCAIKEAVEAGEIAERRYRSYTAFGREREGR